MTRDSRPGLQFALVIVLAAVALIAATLLGHHRPRDAAAGPESGQIAAVNQIIHDYLRDHPEDVDAALRKALEQHRVAEEERRKSNIRAFAKELQSDPDSPAVNSDGDVTVVEFFDYECPYCKAMAPKLRELMNSDKKLRFVFKDFPVLGPVSNFAARAALASRKQDKYIDFHFALMGVRGQLNNDMVLATAKEVGLDLTRLQEDMKAPEIDKILERNKVLGQNVGVEGTPAFVVGGTFVPGAVEINYLKDIVGKERGGS